MWYNQGTFSSLCQTLHLSLYKTFSVLWPLLSSAVSPQITQVFSTSTFKLPVSHSCWQGPSLHDPRLNFPPLAHLFRVSHLPHSPTALLLLKQNTSHHTCHIQKNYILHSHIKKKKNKSCALTVLLFLQNSHTVLVCCFLNSQENISISTTKTAFYKKEFARSQ